jgi:hypothetical protein
VPPVAFPHVTCELAKFAARTSQQVGDYGKLGRKGEIDGSNQAFA